MLMATSRADLLEQARASRCRPPSTSCMPVCEAVHGQDGVGRLRRRQAAPLELDPLPDGHGRRRVPRPAGRSHADARHARGRPGRRVVRQPADEVRPSGVLSFTDDQAMRAQITGRANIRTQAIAWLTPLGQARGQHGQGHRALRADAGRPAPATSPAPTATASASRPARATRRRPGSSSSGRCARRCCAASSLEKGYSAVCRRSVIEQPSLQAGADPERPGRRRPLSAGARARRPVGLHEVPHRAGVPAGRRQDQQGASSASRRGQQEAAAGHARRRRRRRSRPAARRACRSERGG